MDKTKNHSKISTFAGSRGLSIPLFESRFMSDIIRLLPDAVANQIAAGEVIQRPASAVKEMLENAIDAGASHITVVVKEAGKVLIQISDNGSGMSDTDARMCFERHATSKISKAEDLFAIRTMGFRGEAMASIAAVAQVELKSVPHSGSAGTRILIEGSKFVNQEPYAGSPGTSIQVRNLFYNIPARRNFLKSNAAEMRHIVEEFQRVAIARPEIGFSLIDDGKEVLHLKPGNLRQRITGIFGNSYNERLVPVEENTTIMSLGGFICKPEFSKKTRGEQFFFVNGRFIKDGYLHHAVVNAYEQLLPPNTFPSYFLMIDIDPAKIDVNIHPTKTEVKFEDEKSIYAIMRSAVKRALGKFGVMPSIDFDLEPSLNIPVSMYGTIPKAPSININPQYNPFRAESDSPAATAAANSIAVAPLFINEAPGKNLPPVLICQVEYRYVIARWNGQLILIDRQLAHERVLYEQHLSRLVNKTALTQQQLFPQVIEFSAPDQLLLQEHETALQHIGFDLSPLGQRAYAVNGLPAGITPKSVQHTLELILENLRSGLTARAAGINENIAAATAKAMAAKNGSELPEMQVQQILTDLSVCENPSLTPSGKKVWHPLTAQHLSNVFE